MVGRPQSFNENCCKKMIYKTPSRWVQIHTLWISCVEEYDGSSLAVSYISSTFWQYKRLWLMVHVLVSFVLKSELSNNQGRYYYPLRGGKKGEETCSSPFSLTVFFLNTSTLKAQPPLCVKTIRYVQCLIQFLFVSMY